MSRTLVVLWDEVRRRTLRLLQGVGEQEARFHAPGLHNSVLWHAGHCYVVVEWIVAQALGQQPQAPSGWFELFSWESRPERIPAEAWPPLAEVVAQLQQQYQRWRRVFQHLSAAQLDLPSARHPRQSVRRAIVHALHDEACHSGEIWLLRKMYHAQDRL